MKIQKNLNLVIPVTVDDASIVYVHSTPIARLIFESYWHVISRTFSAIINLGLGEVAGPAVAMLALKDTSIQVGRWEGREGVRDGLLPEIWRLTNVLMPARDAGGWDMIPFMDVMARGMLSDEDLAEVQNAIVFFIVISAMLKREKREEMLDGAAKLWGGQITSLGPMEYVASLKTSTVAASSGARPPVAAPVQPAAAPHAPPGPSPLFIPH